MSELGYLYVIEYANGTVKVGRSGKPSVRVGQHKATGVALGVPVTRTWVSDAHENSDETEQKLIAGMGESFAGREWFRDTTFLDAVNIAKDVVQLSTDPELYHKRLMDAVRFVEQHTGTKVKLQRRDISLDSEVMQFFLLDESAYLMSSFAYEHYTRGGGTLTQKAFLAALERQGIERRRSYDGTRLHGIRTA